MNPFKLLSDAGGELLSSVRGIIDQVDTDKQEEMKAKQKLMQIERGFYEKMAEARTKIAEEQGKTIRAEIHSKSWLASNWRPLLMMTFTFIVAWNFIAVPILNVPGAEIPQDMWTLMKIGVGGYIGGRTAEKIIPNSKWGPQQDSEG